MTTIWQESWVAMRKLLPGSVRVGYLCDFSARRRDLQQSARTRPREENHPCAAPRTTVRERQRLADRLNRPACDLDLLEPIVGEESDETAIRRPEGELCSLRTGERPGFGGIESAHPEL